MSELIVGIDLGTTNSALAAVIDGQVRVIDIHGQPTMPSCVGIDPTGKLIVGQAARNQVVAAPDATVLSIKRKMGEDTRVTLGGKEFSPEEISAFILRELKQEGEMALGQPIRKAVITVPAFFNERQRKATRTAGELAGLEVVRIINEPTAAALAYGADRAADETMLVYDLGGGTFDVSLVVVEQGVVEVKASHGDTHLGGDDFDQLLVNHAVLEFQKRHNLDLHQDPRVLRRLKVALEHAKCRLSDEPYVSVREEYLTPEHHLELELQRREYEEMIAHLLEKTLTCVHQSLQDARLGPKDLDKVMLVGGATRTPLVHQLLQERLGLEPRWEINPDLIVAMGAAIQGSIIAGEARHAILVDITPHTFSLVCLGFHDGLERLVCVPIIRRNTPLPASKAELFHTVSDEQDTVIVNVCQGEAPLPEQNTPVGEFTVNGLSPVPAGNPVAVQFNLDLNGMLTVTATEKNTGLSKSVTLDTRAQGGVVDLEAARRNLESLLSPEAGAADRPPAPEAAPDEAAPGPEPAAAPADLLTTAKSLRQRGETLLGRNISAEDADEIRTLIHQSATAIKDRQWSALAEKNDALSDLLFYLED